MPRQPLRCPAKLHGVMVGDHQLEVKCSSRFCGAGNGVVVLHTFDLLTGTVDTHRFSDPVKRERKR